MLSPRTHVMSNEGWVAVIALGGLKIPKGLRPVVDEIVGITDPVCLAVLDEEYADLARRAVAQSCSPPAAPPPAPGWGISNSLAELMI